MSITEIVGAERDTSPLAPLLADFFEDPQYDVIRETCRLEKRPIVLSVQLTLAELNELGEEDPVCTALRDYGQDEFVALLPDGPKQYAIDQFAQGKNVVLIITTDGRLRLRFYPGTFVSPGGSA
jgi:hypothetical protein